MPGTRHFGRMQYHVARGLREIVAPRQTMSGAQWEQIKNDFGGRCIFCDESGTKENRGIVPDHLVPVTSFGELVVGNTVPACQACNDSRGDRDWRSFMRNKLSGNATRQIARIKRYLKRHPYKPVLEDALSNKELREYRALLAEWESMLKRAGRLRTSVEKRRGRMGR